MASAFPCVSEKDMAIKQFPDAKEQPRNWLIETLYFLAKLIRDNKRTSMKELDIHLGGSEEQVSELTEILRGKGYQVQVTVAVDLCGREDLPLFQIKWK